MIVIIVIEVVLNLLGNDSMTMMLTHIRQSQGQHACHTHVFLVVVKHFFL